MSERASNVAATKRDRGILRNGGGAASRRDALQPSLWDRLVNDLPGLETEIDASQRQLAAEIGPERVDALLEGGTRAIEADPQLTQEQRQRIGQLGLQLRRRAELRTTNVTVSVRVLRDAVRRDIEALFNTERYESRPLLTEAEAEMSDDTVLDLADFPEVRRSVVNFGVPSFSGRSSRDFDRDELAREIRGVLATFEPRLKHGETKVEVTLNDKAGGVRIDIDAVLMTTPVAERMRMRTTINLDNGRARTDFRDG